MKLQCKITVPACYGRNFYLLFLIDSVQHFYSSQLGIICEKAKSYAENIHEKQYYTLLCITEIHYMSIRHGEYCKNTLQHRRVHTASTFLVYIVFYICVQIGKYKGRIIWKIN
jgi:hypothetical protein